MISSCRQRRIPVNLLVRTRPFCGGPSSCRTSTRKNTSFTGGCQWRFNIGARKMCQKFQVMRYFSSFELCRAHKSNLCEFIDRIGGFLDFRRRFDQAFCFAPLPSCGCSRKLYSHYFDFLTNESARSALSRISSIFVQLLTSSLLNRHRLSLDGWHAFKRGTWKLGAQLQGGGALAGRLAGGRRWRQLEIIA